MSQLKETLAKRIDQYDPEVHTNHSPLRFNFPIRLTKKAVLFQFDRGVSEWVPLSVLVVDREGKSNLGRKGWFYVNELFKKNQLVKKHPNTDFGFIKSEKENKLPRIEMEFEL